MIKLLKEIRDLLKEILAELRQQKEPTAVTVDSKSLVNHLSSTTHDIHQSSVKQS